MNYKFAQLIQTPGKRGKTATEVFVAQPDSLREKLAGKLFVLTELDCEFSLGQKITSYLLDIIVHNFYQNEKLLLREKIPSIKVEHIFETALAETNKQLSEFFKEEKIPTTFETINICVGVVFENDLYIANSGKNKAYLIYQDKNNKEDKQFQIVDIFPKSNNGEEQINHRLFSNIVNGVIPSKGSVFISNEALPEYVSQKQLINIISSLPPVSAVEQIRGILNNINTYISFAGIIIKSTSLEKTNDTPRVSVQTSYDSIANLNKTEDTTDALLTPSGMISIKKWIKFLSSNKYTKVIPKKLNAPLFLKDRIFMKRKSTFNTAKNIIVNFLANLLKAILNLSKSIGDKHLLKSLFNKIPSQNKYLEKLKIGLSPLIRKKKILLLLSIIFIVASLISIYKTKNSKELVENSQKYDEIIAEIEQKQNQAEASLLYNNDEGAKKLFNEIDALLESLPKDSEEQKSQYLAFREKYDLQLEKIRIITRTDSATELSDFNNLNSRSSAENITYLPEENKIYAADKNQKSIYIFDLFENSPTSITELEIPIDSLSWPFLNGEEDTKSIYYLNGSKLISFNSENNDFNTLETTIDNPESIKGADTYNNILYTLDTKNNNIYKRNKNGESFGAATQWMVDDIDLSKAVDISIDGNIFVLNSDGSVLKLLRGTKVEFQLGLCDPPLEQPNSFNVSKTTDFIYVLEAKNNRLLVYDKKGDFKMQYKGDNLNDLKDFAIDEDQKIIYFLNGTKLLKFNAVHFE